MRKLFFILFVLVLITNQHPCFAQYNYVPNPSFEEYDSTAIYSGGSIICYYYFPKDWFIPVGCSYSNYFNSRLNYVDSVSSGGNVSSYGVPENPWSYTYPYDGIAQSAFCPFEVIPSPFEGFRDYLEVKLKNPLISGIRYCVSFYITLMDTSYIAVDQIGACFTPDSLVYFSPDEEPPCYLLQTPQIVSPPGYFFDRRNQWQCISGQFIAQGGEQYITIGNFKTDANTSYEWLPDESTYSPGSAYHIDMVSVIACDSNIAVAYAGKDTAICKGYSVMLGPAVSLNGYEFYWSPETGLSDPCIKNPIATPAQTTTYILVQTYFSSDTTRDTITLTIHDCVEGLEENNEGEIKIVVYPNPATNSLTIESKTDITQLVISDIMGNVVLQKQPYEHAATIDVSHLAAGIYFIKVANDEGLVVRKFLKE